MTYKFLIFAFSKMNLLTEVSISICSLVKAMDNEANKVGEGIRGVHN